jgi:uncharacterized protein YdiU (UPF0061 family)
LERWADSDWKLSPSTTPMRVSPKPFTRDLDPTPFSAPSYLVHANRAAAELIDLDPEQFARPEFVALLEVAPEI